MQESEGFYLLTLMPFLSPFLTFRDVFLKKIMPPITKWQPMNTNDFIMDYSNGNHPIGLYRVRLFNSKKHNLSLIITDIGDMNTGPSVTNSIGQIISKLKAEKKIDSSTIIFEHYEPTFIYDHSFDIVTFDDAMQPVWESISAEKVCDMCEIDKLELMSLVEDDKSLMKEVLTKTKLILLKKRNSNRIENHDECKYKLYKKDIRNLINIDASEKEFQNLLNSDLSLIAEVLADPKNEYICFSEFPIGRRRADFVLFTGRSKMNVFIIEIKGANFFFQTRGLIKK